MRNLSTGSSDLMRAFPTEEASRKHMERVRWQGKVTCPDCDSANIYARKGERQGFFDCRDCSKHFTVRTGTVFEKSHTPLRKWMHGIHMLMSVRNDLSPLLMSKQIKISQKAAWFMFHRLRLACGNNLDKLHDLFSTGETDERSEENSREHKKLKANRMVADKQAVAYKHADKTEQGALQKKFGRRNSVEQATLDMGLSLVMRARPARVNDALPRLIRADATQSSVLERNSVDLVITSPPYNVGKAYSGDSTDDSLTYKEYEAFSKKWLKNCYQWTRHTGRLCLNVGLDKNKHGKQPVAADITHWAMSVGWKYHATILWNEGNISRRTAWGSWKSASAPHVIAPVEVIIVLYKGEWKRERQGDNDISADEFKDWVLGIWKFNGESAKRVGHEAPFPRELPKRCMKLFSFVGDTILDPFMGSGTTMIEAITNGRIAIGIEKEKKYCDLTKKRVQSVCGVRL